MMVLARTALKAPLCAFGAIRQWMHEPDAKKGIALLIYHRVDGRLPFELDMPIKTFERQMAHLAQCEQVMSIEEALASLGTPNTASASGIVLTFDDGYEDFYTNVYPLLVEYNLPAILYVTTGFVEEGVAYPMLSHPDACVAPVTWEMLGEMAESRLVTIGAHTHRHPVLSRLGAREIEDELARPLELFERCLGLRPKHFAYPRAEVSAEAQAMVEKYYASAVVGGGRRATVDGFDRYRIPRIPIRRSDGWAFFRAKLRGWLDAEEPMYARLRSLTGRGSA